MGKEKVTVVIPCYNDGRFIKQAVDSILNQTFQDFHVIIVDDGSHNDNLAVLSKLKGPRVEVIRQENQGVSAARNNGIRVADSEFILTLDADDYFEPTFLEKAISALTMHKHAEVVACYYYQVLNGVKEKLIKPLGGDIQNFLLKNSGVASALFRKASWERVGGYDEMLLKGYEDWDFWISLLSLEREMYIIEEPLFNYRIKPVSRDQKAVLDYDLELRKYIFKKHEKLYKDHFEYLVPELLSEQSKAQKTIKALKESKALHIGKFILAPVRYLKKCLKA